MDWVATTNAERLAVKLPGRTLLGVLAEFTSFADNCRARVKDAFVVI